MPILKYSLFVGASLLALIMMAGQFSDPIPATATQSSSASSLDLLRKMANHGELRPFASAAAAGPFTAMPVVSTPTVVAAAASPPETVKPTPAAALDAQARLDEPRVAEKPARPSKKVASRKQKPRYAYVETIPRESGGFFGGLQSW